MKKLLIISICVISISTTLIMCGGKNTSQTNTTTNTATETSKAEEEKLKEEKEIKELQEKYKTILESGKTYDIMTNEEGEIAVEMVSNWYKLNDDFKSQYNDAKEVIAKSITDYNDKKAKEAEAARLAAEAASYDTGITYEQLARTPDEYKGQKVKFSGKVVQVMEGDDETQLRIAVDGNYDTIIYVGYKPEITSTRILENDYVTIRGESIGIFSYQSTMGGKISIPGIYVSQIELNQ